MGILENILDRIPKVSLDPEQSLWKNIPQSGSKVLAP